MTAVIVKFKPGFKTVKDSVSEPTNSASSGSTDVSENGVKRAGEDHETSENGVEEKLAAARTCGLCGENTQDRRADLKSPRMCVFKSIKSMVQSYRVEDSQCVSPLSTSDRNNLKSQSSMCTSSKTVKQQRLTQQKLQHTISKVIPRGPMYGGNKRISEVELRKHAIMHRAGEICFSKDQVAECAANAVARAIEPRDVEFVCRPLRDRVRMAREGEVIPQLRGLEKTFQARVELPRVC